jgi:hypothetical protein
MSMSHVLQDSPLCEALRKDIWPNGVNLQDQMQGDRADMQRTAEYIRRVGLTALKKVNAKKIKKKKKKKKTIEE